MADSKAKAVYQLQQNFRRTMGVMKIPDELKDIIISDPERMSGVPCFVGTRVPFHMLIDHIEAGIGLDEFLDDYPGVGKANAERVLFWLANEGRKILGMEPAA